MPDRRWLAEAIARARRSVRKDTCPYREQPTVEFRTIAATSGSVDEHATSRAAVDVARPAVADGRLNAPAATSSNTSPSAATGCAVPGRGPRRPPNGSAPCAVAIRGFVSLTA